MEWNFKFEPVFKIQNLGQIDITRFYFLFKKKYEIIFEII